VNQTKNSSQIVMGTPRQRINKPREPAPPARPDRAGMYVRNVFNGRPDTKLNGILGIKNLSEDQQYRFVVSLVETLLEGN
jgi:hypothetical protein